MNQRERTLVILTPGFAISEADTNCLPLQQSFILRLKALFPEINIVILAFQYPYSAQTYHWFGIPVISFDGKNKGGVVRLLLRKKIQKTLADIHSKSAIIGLLSFWYGECALVGQRFATAFRIPHYCWIMGQDAKKDNKYPGKVSLRKGRLIALSDFLQEEFARNHLVRPAHVLPLGIEPPAANKIQNERSIDILAAGSLIPLKQFNLLPGIIAGIKKQLPSVRVVLAGDGQEKNKLQTMIKDAQLESNFLLAGELPYPELLETMERSRVFLHPSSYEGFSGVCLEALSRGCRVISFCSPMNEPMRHWEIVRSTGEMTEKTIALLQKSNSYSSIVPFTMDDTARKIGSLFFSSSSIDFSNTKSGE